MVGRVWGGRRGGWSVDRPSHPVGACLLGGLQGALSPIRSSHLYIDAHRTAAAHPPIHNPPTRSFPKHTQCDARLHGLKAAQQLLAQGFRGWDKRLCMMQVLDLFRGQGSVEEVRCTGLGGWL